VVELCKGTFCSPFPARLRPHLCALRQPNPTPITRSTHPQICKLTELYEGSIIRATRRLDELLTQLGDAAGEVGDKRLQQQFKDAQATIRRDIIFAASLYI